jgi:chromate transporter
LPPVPLDIRVPRIAAIAAAGVLLLLLLVLPAVAPPDSTLAFFAVFFRAGCLVFGGGHVVLPLLQSLISPQTVSGPTFLAGYGAAQAMPGRCSPSRPLCARAPPAVR